ncbi:single-stranded DNA-binding protein [Hanamia caeni]|uniref:Single-stranded DNA-binding protein n=1 Tax=Hanamia caeni TaxID=2294116 RepID=A0A3M9NC21_9BACT|nr:single-stranded DNA-binding protein [Hanamia caeni]RNI34945.1 single-stranded DNA-binding protein [Hanamia caeni]
MQGINKVIFVGNCGKDAESKTLADGTMVAKIAIATTETFRMKNGELHSRTDWHTVILWGGLAALASQYLRKGSLVYIEGRLQNRQYATKEDDKKFVTEVVAGKLVLLDKKNKTNLNQASAPVDEDVSF